MGNLSTHFPAPTSSNVLEHLIWQPDGRTIKTVNGDKTADNLTASFIPGTTFVDGGSTIAYTPPTGTKNLLFSMNFNYTRDGTSGPIWLTKITIDGTDWVGSHDSMYGGADDYYNTVNVQRCFQVGASSENIAAGIIGTWTSDKTLEYRVASYSSTYDWKFGNNVYIPGGGENTFQRPTYQLIATT
jgi:hypothetical protein